MNKLKMEGKVYQDIYKRVEMKAISRKIEKNIAFIWYKLREFLYMMNWKESINPIAEKII